MTSHRKTSRRHFIQTASSGLAAGTATGFGRAMLPGEQRSVSPANHIGIATIGLGQQGFADTRAAVSLPGVKLVGIADLYDGRRRRAVEVFGPGIATTADYRELLDRQDVDAVLIATADHWHAPICIQAMQAGKDVYCEKPMVQKLSQGLEVIRAERETGRILQVGSQRTSSPLSHKARELIASGAIGDLILIEAWYNRSSTNGAWEYVIPPDASPATVEWDRFLGKAPRRPFDANRFFRWRNYWDYGTGIPGDLFVHLLTAVHFVCNSLGPVRVFGDGGLRYWKDDREVPDLMMGLYEYPQTGAHPAFNLVLKVNFADSVESSGMRIVGSKAVMTLGRSLTLTKSPRDPDIRPSISTFPEAMQRELLSRHESGVQQVVAKENTTTYEPPPGVGGTALHMANFLSAVRSREPVVQDATFGLRAAAPALLANHSYQQRGVVAWDPTNLAETTP